MSYTDRPPRRGSPSAAALALLALAALVGVALGCVLVLAVGSGNSSTTVHIVKVVQTSTSGKHTGHHPSGTGPAKRARSKAVARRANKVVSDAAILKPGSKQSFAQFAGRQPGAIGIALMQVGTRNSVTLGDDSAAPAWSTSKVPVLAALILKRNPAPLTAAEQSLAQTAISISDNQSIIDLFADLSHLTGGGTVGASDYIDQLFRNSGDDQTTVSTNPNLPYGAVTTFGQTPWSPSNSVKFFAALSEQCLLPPSGTHYVLNLMEHISPADAWGFGTAKFGVPVAYKGGWGPADGDSGQYLVRQSAIVDPGTHRAVAVAVVAHAQDGFESGTEMLTAAAQWVADHLNLQRHTAQVCVGGGGGN